eukprot:TRINITY_DN3727_c0_g1_i1.p1 TRINITY_DN3727_c0_g1~~TRINITY_DN3727_c0_g1_i1.p1  ORF type:complete len:620 (-),score=191.39 TRINITY_DN3727_c0_g1_i1:153-2012(-)
MAGYGVYPPPGYGYDQYAYAALAASSQAAPGQAPLPPPPGAPPPAVAAPGYPAAYPPQQYPGYPPPGYPPGYPVPGYGYAPGYPYGYPGQAPEAVPAGYNGMPPPGVISTTADFAQAAARKEKKSKASSGRRRERSDSRDRRDSKVRDRSRSPRRRSRSRGRDRKSKDRDGAAARKGKQEGHASEAPAGDGASEDPYPFEEEQRQLELKAQLQKRKQQLAEKEASKAEEASKKAEEEARKAEERRKKAEEDERRKKQEALLKKKTDEERRRMEQHAVFIIKQAIMKLTSSTPDTFESLRQDLEQLLLDELYKCGNFQDGLQMEATKQIEKVRQRMDAILEQQKQSGIVVCPHSIEDSERRKWLKWRLDATIQVFGAKAEVGVGTVMLEGKAQQIEESKRELARDTVQAAVDEAEELKELTVDGLTDVMPEHVDMGLIAPFIDQYGVQVRMFDPRGNVVPVHVLGPPDAANDVAAILWLRFVQGKSVAAVLTLPDQLQAMAPEMKGDYQADVKALENEHGVEVQQGNVATWIMGPTPEAVILAKAMLEEMLTFYMAADFQLVKGLEADHVERLRKDDMLKLLMSKKGVVVAMDSGAGTVWICGKMRGPVQHRIEAVRHAA